MRWIGLAAAAVLVVTLSCGEHGSPLAPTVESRSLETAASAAEIRNLIGKLYPRPILYGAAIFHFFTIEQDVRFGRLGQARASAQLFIRLALRLNDSGFLLDPRGPTTTNDALARLIQLLLEFVGQSQGGQVPPGAFGRDGAFQPCGPQGCRVVTGTKFAGVVIPPEALDRDVFIAISRLPDEWPLDSDLAQYPLFYQFSTFPETELDGTVVVGVCVVDPPDPLAPDPDIVNRLRLAHPNGAGGIEILPLANASFLDCRRARTSGQQNASDGLPAWVSSLAHLWAAEEFFTRRTVRLVEPRTLHADPGNLGALASSFSPFAAVDPQSGDGTPTNISGTYQGTLSGTASGVPFSQNVVFTIVQSGNSFNGTLTADGGTTGTISGVVSGTGSSFSFAQTSPCTGNFIGGATITNAGDTISGSFEGSSFCTGQVLANFVLNRVGGS